MNVMWERIDMVRNDQLHQVIVYCRNCIHRSTETCPRFITFFNGCSYIDDYSIDTTTEWGYCEEGEGELE